MVKTDWTIKAAERIQKIFEEMDEKRAKKYKLDMLARIVQRVHMFSLDGCKDCETLKENIDDLILFLEQKNNMDNKQYNSTFRLVVKHLVKSHGLVENGTNLSLWIAYGLIIGGAFSAFYHLAIAYGLLFGIVVGTNLDAKAKKEGRII